MPAEFACPRCMCPGERFAKVAGQDDRGGAAEPAEGAGEPAGMPADIAADLRADFEGACGEVGAYLAMARVAEHEGYAEVAAYWEKVAHEKAGHAARFAELLGDIVADSTQQNLKTRIAVERGAAADKAGLACRAAQASLDAVHDAVSEMARDDERHGRALEALLKRFFG